jgi:spore maturation protein CgeB
LNEALRLAGLTLTHEEELVLPIQVSFKEIGIEAVIVSIRRSDAEPRSAEEIARALLPGGEPPDGQSTLGNDLEYWMTLNYARELAERGDLERARETLEYAERVSHTTAVDVRDLLERITDKLKSSPGAPTPHSASVPTPVDAAASTSARGWSQLVAKFPNVGTQSAIDLKQGSIEMRSTEEGPAMFLDGIPLDHVHKPRSSAQAWAKQVMSDPRYRDCDEVVIVGLGSGYHLEALKEQGCEKPIHVLEESLAVVKAAAEARPDTWVHVLASLSVGRSAKVPAGDRKIELFLRAQSQAAAPEFCAQIRSDFYGSRGLALLKPQIGVLGPLSGGTLPMVPYLCRGLYGVGQRFREYDVSGFSGGYDQVAKFIRDKSRRTGVENTFCEMVSQVLLESVNERPIDILICLALAPISPRVLMELRKRGVITVLWFVEDYTRFTYWKEMAQYYDFVFTIQRGQCLEAIRGAGAGAVHYLPVACDPGIHAPMALSAEERQRWGSPVSFMGAGYHNRQQLFASLAEYPLKIWGTEWPECRPFDRMVQEGGRRLTPSEYVKVFNASDININLHSSHERDGVDPFGDFLNPRTFELAASGAFQLVDQRSLLPEAFDVGSEIVTFSNVRELKEQIEYYLAHPEERGRIAQAGRARALKDHTYHARLKQMLSIVFSSRYEQLKNRLDQSPWQKVLSRAKQYPELYERCERAFQRGEEPNLDGLVSDVVTGQGKLSETEQKLMFLFHVRKQIIRMREEETSGKA